MKQKNKYKETSRLQCFYVDKTMPYPILPIVTHRSKQPISTQTTFANTCTQQIGKLSCDKQFKMQSPPKPSKRASPSGSISSSSQPPRHSAATAGTSSESLSHCTAANLRTIYRSKQFKTDHPTSMLANHDRRCTAPPPGGLDGAEHDGL